MVCNIVYQQCNNCVPSTNLCSCCSSSFLSSTLLSYSSSAFESSWETRKVSPAGGFSILGQRESYLPCCFMGKFRLYPDAILSVTGTVMQFYQFCDAILSVTGIIITKQVFNQRVGNQRFSPKNSQPSYKPRKAVSNVLNFPRPSSMLLIATISEKFYYKVQLG